MGWSQPGTEVTVTFAGQVKHARAGADGRWEVSLNPLKASSQPADLVITAGETRTLTNILVGEVWLCSGQSNMEKPIGKQPGQKPCFNYEQELAAADFPEIRLFKAHTALAAVPQKDVTKTQRLAGMQFQYARSHQIFRRGLLFRPGNS